MEFDPSARCSAMLARLDAFCSAHIEPNEARYAEELAANTAAGRRWTPLPLIEELKAKAREAGLWNLFLSDPRHGGGLTTLDYAPLAERMGRVPWSAEVFNCSAPDSGNMELLLLAADAEQRARWLQPLLDGRIRSAFAMTEPDAPSSDATAIATRFSREGDGWRIDGRKAWISGAGDPRCAFHIVVGVSDPDAEPHRRHSLLLVPSDAPGLTVGRALPVFGFDDAPHGHCELDFDGVRVADAALLGSRGHGFELLQARLGPGRIHHCMRLIGLAERALELMCQRALSRRPFGRPLAEQGVWRERIAQARCRIEQARLLTLRAADRIDRHGARAARADIAMIKIVAPRMACDIVDDAIQCFGAAGLADARLAGFYMIARALRIADGPDEVHCDSLARQELRRHREPSP